MPKPTYSEIISSLEKAQQISEAKEVDDVQYAYYYLNTVVKRILRGARTAGRPIRNWKDGNLEHEQNTMSHMLEGTD